MKDREVQVEDLFDLKPSIEQRIYAHIKKHKRTTQSLAAEHCNISVCSAKRYLAGFVRDGLVKDLGVFAVNGRSVRVYELK